MKLFKTLGSVAFAVALLAGTSLALADDKPAQDKDKAAAKQTCCEKAKADGKECSHKCCVAAKKDGKTCEACNPAKDKKDAPAEKK